MPHGLDPKNNPVAPVRRSAAVVLVVACLVGGFAHAICPHPTPKVCSEFFESDAVFVGTVLRREYRGDEDDDDRQIRYLVLVSRVFRGSVGRLAEVFTPDTSIRLWLDEWKDYVVFARLGNGRFESWDTCGPLSESETVPETIRQIEALRRVDMATLEGEIRIREPDGPGIAGVPVRIRGEGEEYTIATDSEGSFALRVPPGLYSVSVDDTLKVSDYNGRDPASLRLVRGQCAQLLFVPR